MLGIAFVLAAVCILSGIRLVWAIWRINRALQQFMESLRPAQSGKVISLLEIRARKVKGS